MLDNLCTIYLYRSQSNSFGTFGKLHIKGSEFHTLEPVRPLIPVGNYLVTFTYSPKFSNKFPYKNYKGVPLVNGVPLHEGIRIHIGNSLKDTNGCILIGHNSDGTILYDSSHAYQSFMGLLSSIISSNKNSFFILQVNEAV